jgi:hypothetical protein
MRGGSLCRRAFAFSKQEVFMTEITIPSNLATLLVWLTGPGAAIIASRLVERSEWFTWLSPQGKLCTVFAITALIAACAVGAQQFLVGRPDVAAAVDPYVVAILTAVSFVATQVVHGASKAAQHLLHGERG